MIESDLTTSNLPARGALFNRRQIAQCVLLLSALALGGRAVAESAKLVPAPTAEAAGSGLTQTIVVSGGCF